MVATKYRVDEKVANETVSDVLSDCQLSLFPLKEVDSNGKLRVLSLFQAVVVWI